MTDYLNDPRFPDRPQHPDFWRLSETAMKLDGKAEEGQESVGDITNELIDLDSITYAASERIDNTLRQLGMVLPVSLRILLISTYVGAVAHGIEFQKAGGHRA